MWSTLLSVTLQTLPLQPITPIDVEASFVEEATTSGTTETISLTPVFEPELEIYHQGEPLPDPFVIYTESDWVALVLPNIVTTADVWIIHAVYEDAAGPIECDGSAGVCVLVLPVHSYGDITFTAESQNTGQTKPKKPIKIEVEPVTQPSTSRSPNDAEFTFVVMI